MLNIWFDALDHEIISAEYNGDIKLLTIHCMYRGMEKGDIRFFDVEDRHAVDRIMQRRNELIFAVKREDINELYYIQFKNGNVRQIEIKASGYDFKYR